MKAHHSLVDHCSLRVSGGALAMKNLWVNTVQYQEHYLHRHLGKTLEPSTILKNHQIGNSEGNQAMVTTWKTRASMDPRRGQWGTRPLSPTFFHGG